MYSVLNNKREERQVDRQEIKKKKIKKKYGKFTDIVNFYLEYKRFTDSFNTKYSSVN